MIRILAESTLQLLIVFPIVLITLKKKDGETIKILIAFTSYFFLNQTLLLLPIIYPALKIFDWNTNWNWMGKIYAVVGAVLFLSIYRKFTLSDYFLTFKQNKDYLKKGIFLILSILVIQMILAFYSPEITYNSETLFFQFTMPGLNEEIAYRGIMLGLLIKVLKTPNLITNPAVWVTATLFGLAHGFSLSNTFEIAFNLQPFLVSMIYGLLWGWITLKSGSILLALISHNLINGTMNLIRMR